MNSEYVDISEARLILSTKEVECDNTLLDLEVLKADGSIGKVRIDTIKYMIA